MQLLLVVVLAVAIPAGLAGLLGLVDGLARWEPGRRRRRRHRVAPGPPVERLAADLHRLSVQIDALADSDLPAKVARMTAAGRAYDDALVLAARALDLPAAARGPLTATERLETEAELARAGLTW